MTITEEHRKAISDEFKAVSNLMRQEQDVLRKTFYFSGAHAVIQRVLNLEFEPSLILLHTVLQGVYTALNIRLQAIMQGQERIIEIPDVALSRLADYLEELGDSIRQNKDIIQPLMKISQVGYSTTGNGYYLYKKGVLKLD